MREQQNTEYKSSNGQLKRAAIVLFGKDPGRFYPNTFVKIGRFAKDDADLRFQEVEEGNIIVLIRNALEQLNHKFLIRNIEFEGFFRIEKGEYPVPALREMLLNALVHRSYMGSFIQKRTAVYELIEMVEKHKIFKQFGASVGTYYEI